MAPGTFDLCEYLYFDFKLNDANVGFKLGIHSMLMFIFDCA